MENNTNREQWLLLGKKELDIHVQEKTGLKPIDTLVSIGSPLRGDRKGKVLGVCYNMLVKRPHIFITPRKADSPRILDILLHEIIHTHTPGDGHRGPFKRLALKCGLLGPMTATTAGSELKQTLKKIIEKIGQIPSDPLTQEAIDGKHKKQSTRLIKSKCQPCGYTVRITRTWIESLGHPICPGCNRRMLYGKLGDIK